MKYRVKIELIEIAPGEKPGYEIKDIYEQIVENLDIWAVIQATNQKEQKP